MASRRKKNKQNAWLSFVFIFFRANLSDSYFTNRQDRYVLLEDCSELADFFSELVEAVGDVSLQLGPDDSVAMQDGMVHPYKGYQHLDLFLFCLFVSLGCNHATAQKIGVASL